MSLFDELRKWEPIELAKTLAQCAKENAALRDRVDELEHENFWLKAVEREGTATKTNKRQWRKPIEEDKKRKCRARNRYEKNAFYVRWNAGYGTWAIHDRPHILVAVDEVLEP